MGAEKNFENKVKNYLTSKGCWCVKYFANKFTPVGIPDLLICCNGHFIGAEIKSKTGTPSELQKYHIEKIKQSNGHALVLRPQNFDEFKELIEELLND